MKPFDLEAAKRGEPIQCCGMSAKFIAHEPEASPYQRVIFLGHGTQVYAVDENGGGSHHKLTMAPKKRTVWVNFYEQIAYHYDSEQEADSDASQFTKMKRNGDKAYPVEIEE